MQEKIIKVGIVGGAGYTAGELLRILLFHPNAVVSSVTSTSNAGNPIHKVHDDLLGQTDLVFSKELSGEEDIVFLCLGHGNSRAYLEHNTISASTRIVDMSNDFRLNDNATFMGRTYVYGLPELQKGKIIQAQNIANPGCFATAIQLAILPLAKANMLQNAVHISAITGSTGAGRGHSDTTHFSWRSSNVSIYKPFTHQHIPEIDQSIQILQAGVSPTINFIPYRGNFTRGIFASCYTTFDGSIDKAIEIYKEFYQNEPFVHVSDVPIHVKQVVGTNNGIVHLEKHNDQLLVTSAIDNLAKGASGQAVQNMNLMFGLKEDTGLKIRALQF